MAFRFDDQQDIANSPAGDDACAISLLSGRPVAPFTCFPVCERAPIGLQRVLRAAAGD
jgi:hypothetical protein